MKKMEVLKIAVILQAVCMIALTGMVIVKVWPLPSIRGTEHGTEKALPPIEQGDTGIQMDEEQVVAIVGGKHIKRSELTVELYKLHGDSMLRTMMLREAIRMEAEASGLVVSQLDLENELAKSAEGYENEEVFLEVMKTQLGMTKKQVMEELNYKLLLDQIAIGDVIVTDAEADEYIEDHPEQFEPRLQLHLQWIVTDTQEQAGHIVERLVNGEDFASLAQQYSTDEFSSAAGGDLGLIDADDPFYDQAILTTAKAMSVAEYAGPIALADGYAVIGLMGRKSSSVLEGHSLLASARKLLAMERAKPLQVIEEELLKRYEAAIVK